MQSKRPSQSSRAVTESLETRRLLAGVTIITHGFNSSAGDGSWADRMGDAVADRAGGAAQYTLAVTGSSSAPNAHTFTLDAGSPPWSAAGDASNPSGELIIKLDWGAVSASSGVSTVEVADYTSGVLIAGLLPRSLLELPIHLIGHSRGASLIVALARNLGRAGLWVDQLTGLDSHPVDGVREPPLLNFDWGDAPMEAHANVLYADSYYRPANGNLFDFGGEPIPGAANFGPLDLPGGSSLDHSDVHAFYHGTIDRDSTSNGAGGPIVASWYGDAASRASAGFDRTRLGKGARLTAGIGTTFGGTGMRTAVAVTSAQWFSNVGLLSLSDLDGTISAGEPTSLQYVYQESHAGSANIEFAIDNNTNPYDGAIVQLGSDSRPSTGGANAAGSFSFSMPLLADGIKFVSTKITNPDGRVRYAYLNAPLAYADGRAVVMTREFTGEIAGNLQLTEPRNFAPGGVPTAADRLVLQRNVVGEINSLQTVDAVAVMGQALLRLNSAGTNLRTESLQVGNQATLDIGLANVIVDYDETSPALPLNARIATAYNGGAWDGPGITSSQVLVAPGTAVGIAFAGHVFTSFPGAFGGEWVDATTVLITRTLVADANLDLAVDLDDFTILAANFGQSDRIFGQGDFNYSGAVSLDDFTILASAFGTFLPAATPSGRLPGLAAPTPPARFSKSPITADVLALEW